MKRNLSLIFILGFFATIFSQNTVKTEFRKINSEYYNERIALKNKYFPLKPNGKPVNFSKSEEGANQIAYSKELALLEKNRKESEDSLIAKIEKENPIIGTKAVSEVDIPSNIKQTMHEYYPKLSRDISAAINRNYLSKDGIEKQCNLKFKVDSDGRLKDIKAEGAYKYFNRHVLKTLYELNVRVKPQVENGQYIVENFNLPIKLIF